MLTGAGLSIGAMLCGVSGLAFAIGVYLPLATMAPLYVGGCVRALAERERGPIPAGESDPGVLAASGLVAGEGLAGVAVAGLVAAGLAPKVDGSAPRRPRGRGDRPRGRTWRVLLPAARRARSVPAYVEAAARRSGSVTYLPGRRESIPGASRAASLPRDARQISHRPRTPDTPSGAYGINPDARYVSRPSITVSSTFASSSRSGGSASRSSDSTTKSAYLPGVIVSFCASSKLA